MGKKSLDVEERMVAELKQIGITYLSRQTNAKELRGYLGSYYCQLPDLYSSEIKLDSSAPLAQLLELSKFHQQGTGETLNWAGTYDSVARNIIRRWKLEEQWKLLQQLP